MTQKNQQRLLFLIIPSITLLLGELVIGLVPEAWAPSPWHLYWMMGLLVALGVFVSYLNQRGDRASSEDMPVDFSPTVFISYTGEGKKQYRWVQQFCDDLVKKHGISTLLDFTYSTYGESLKEYIERNSDKHQDHGIEVVIFIVTRELIEAMSRSNEVQHYPQVTDAQLRKGTHLRVVGIYIETSIVVPHLGDHHYMDFRDDARYAANLEELSDLIWGEHTKSTLKSTARPEAPPKTTPPTPEPETEVPVPLFKRIPIIAAAITAVGALLAALITGSIPLLKPEPARFAVLNKSLQPDAPLVIEARNASANRDDTLDVAWDGSTYRRAARPIPNTDPQQWQFVLTQQSGLRPDATLDGLHALRLALPGQAWSDSDNVFLNTKAPLVQAEITPIENRPQDRRVEGRAFSHVAIDDEVIQVEILIHREGPVERVPVAITKHEKGGQVYFTFEATIPNISKLEPDDPRYEAEYFALSVTDGAGVQTSYVDSYARFIAPGPYHFRMGVAQVQVVKRPHQDESDPTISMNFVPGQQAVRPQEDGTGVLQLQVTALTADFSKNELVIRHLPDSLRDPMILTQIYRDGMLIDAVGRAIYDTTGQVVDYADETKYIDRPPAGTVPIYSIEETGRDGQVYTSDEVSALELTTVLIPAGGFLMGSPEGVGDPDERPQREVYLDAYAIMKYPLTNLQYQVFLNANPNHSAPEDWTNRQYPPGKAQHPVVHISWHDAVACASWYSQVTGYEYRLPTEAEWEKAARGTDGWLYPWGNALDPSKSNTQESGVGGTTTVDAYPQGVSPYGVMDMVGNVFEWCADWYDRVYYQKGEDRNPRGPVQGKWRVVRGGSWFDGYADARCSVRDWGPSGGQNGRVGVRFSRNL